MTSSFIESMTGSISYKFQCSKHERYSLSYYMSLRYNNNLACMIEVGYVRYIRFTCQDNQVHLYQNRTEQILFQTCT